MPEPDDKETTTPVATSERSSGPDDTETTTTPVKGEPSPAPHGADVDEAQDVEAPEKQRKHWVFYGLGLSLQTLLWFLLFLAITIAVLVGNKLTEFRYVGF